MENESTHTGRSGVPKAQTLGNHVTATAVVRSRCSFISVMEAFQWFMQNFDTHLTIAGYLDYKILQVSNCRTSKRAPQASCNFHVFR